jgi:S-adenosyl methyltransferase
MADPSVTSPEPGLPLIDTSRPSAARVYDYYLGGKDNYAADREAGDRVLEASPGAARAARDNRRYLGRVVRYLAGEAGIRQFLDIGTGLPSGDNVHEVAQRIAPDARIVYVDNDPIVLSHARALLTSSPAGACAYIHADLREPGKILEQAAQTLDFSKPVVLMLVAILHFIPDADDPRAIVAELVGTLAKGSYLALSATSLNNLSVAQSADLQVQYARTPSGVVKLRSAEEIARFFEGLQLVEPGLVDITKWRPAEGEKAEQQPGDAVLLGGIGSKS